MQQIHLRSIYESYLVCTRPKNTHENLVEVKAYVSIEKCVITESHFSAAVSDLLSCAHTWMQPGQLQWEAVKKRAL